MEHSRDDVLAALHGSFSKDRWPAVLALLDTYGVEPHEREVHRVHLALLKLGQSSEEKLKGYISIAKRDYRDILLWADRPAESRADALAKKGELMDVLKKLGVEPPAELE